MQSRCPLCNGYKVKSTTTFTADLGFGVVVVRHVPATVCEQCSAEWIDDDNAELLERIVLEAKNKQAMVEISEFSALEKLAS
ncbi:type II toxin-antitoxin system MqsA family antitoxin [Sulfurimonas sp. SAG-AH-194-C21]|nr:type II toxin-antitoxin system MqsA family antitoxin [Sulfurimonas sp. SAG-AH-194-C21]MDF1882967.1 type II toxin-antitoxin system MqsA family antitoxin [Sulfurimonas sp. SAG-AH-194-C21]